MYISKRALVIVIILVVAVSFVFGYVNSFTNLYGSYPSFSSKTSKPSKPWSKDSFLASRYKQEVEQYRDDGDSYIRAANNDILTIESAKRDAQSDVNDAIREYNSWVTTGY
ncbi:MAG: hypothetical protein WAZ99_11235 [Rectinemataceae bacterium]